MFKFSSRKTDGFLHGRGLCIGFIDFGEEGITFITDHRSSIDAGEVTQTEITEDGQLHFKTEDGDYFLKPV